MKCDVCAKAYEAVNGMPWPWYILTGSNRHAMLCGETCVAQWAIENGARTRTVVVIDA